MAKLGSTNVSKYSKPIQIGQPDQLIQVKSFLICTILVIF